MRFGVFLLAPQFPGQDHSEVLDTTVAAAVAAEDAGFDDVWIAEHHFMSYGICPSAITLASYLLGVTRRIDVGTAVSVLSTQHPVALAEQARLLDQVSDRRFRLGIGRGGPWVDLEVFGTGLDRFHTGFAESLDVLLAALSRPRVSADGTRFRFRQVDMVPQSRTRPHPPLALACTSRDSAALAAHHRLPMLLGMHADDAEKADFTRYYAELAGPGPIGHLAAAVGYVADTRAEALATMRDRLPRWLAAGLNGYVRIDGRPHRPRDAEDYADLLCRLHPVGTPEDCVQRLTTTVERTGIDHIVLLAEGAGQRRATLDNIARLGAEVLPRLRSKCLSSMAWNAGHNSERRGQGKPGDGGEQPQ